MSERNVNVRHKQRSDVAANWADVNPILLLGEFGVESDTGMVKIGDGVQTWNNLPYLKVKKADIIDLSDSPPEVHVGPEAPTGDEVFWVDTDEDYEVGVPQHTHQPNDIVNLPAYSNPNILHNWDFRNPINQRGVSGGSWVPGQYGFDRWKSASGKPAPHFTGTYLQLPVGSQIYQNIETDRLKGSTCTLTIMNGPTIVYKVTGVFPLSDGKNTYTIGAEYSIEFIVSGAMSSVSIQSLTTINLQTVKLELGAVSTLHLDPPMDHAVELPKCQRFYLNIHGAKPVGIAYSTVFAILFLPTVCPMRTAPTSQAGTISVYHNGSKQTVSIVEITRFLRGLEIKVQGTFSANQAVIGEPIASPHGLTSDL